MREMTFFSLSIDLDRTLDRREWNRVMTESQLDMQFYAASRATVKVRRSSILGLSKSRIVLILSSVVSLLWSAPALAHLQGYGFAYADQPSQPFYEAELSTSYNDGGGAVGISRFGPGDYAVAFADLGDVGVSLGHTQVTSATPGTHYCNVASWTASTANVRCYGLLGVLSDARFNVLVLRPGPELSDYAYAWVDDSTSPSSTPTPFYLYNPVPGGAATVTRNRVGQYSIRWEGLETIGYGPRIDLVTAYGSNARCQVDGFVRDGFNIRCHSALGIAMDSLFTALSMKTQSDDNGWGFARVSSPYSLGYTLDSFNAGLQDPPTVNHPTAGVYELEWPGLDEIGINLGSVQVSADSFYDRFCGIDPEDGDSVTVRCFDSGGTPTDTEFQTLFVKPPKKVWLRDFSFAYADYNLSSGPFPYPSLAESSRNPLGESINIDRISTGVFHVEFRGTDVFPVSGHVQVSAVGQTPNHCNVETSYDEWAEIRCYNEAGFLENTEFNVLQLKPSSAADSVAYVRADQPFSAAYTVNSNLAKNPAGNPVNITRSAVGVYNVDFPGFASFGDDGGNPQVSAFGFTSGRCQVASWGADFVNVRCFNSAGAPADNAFNLALVHADENDEALAYVYSSSSTSPTFTPIATWAFQSGEGPITGVRDGTGLYTITFDGFDEQGLELGNVFVTTYGSLEGSCNSYSWSEETVSVSCFDTNGVPVDRRFSLLFVKDTNNTRLEEVFLPVAVPEPGFALGLFVGLFGLVVSGRRARAATYCH